MMQVECDEQKVNAACAGKTVVSIGFSRREYDGREYGDPVRVTINFSDGSFLEVGDEDWGLSAELWTNQGGGGSHE